MQKESTLVDHAVQTVLSSFTAPRGPLSPLGDARGVCELLRCAANIVYCSSVVWADRSI